MSRPVETKVQTATGGSVAGSAVGTLAVWLLGVTVWGAPFDAAAAPEALAAVPGPVSAVVLLLVTAAGAFYGGWVGKHTARPDLEHAADHGPDDLVR